MKMKDILDYVKHTPENTNPAILKQMINNSINEKYVPVSITFEKVDNSHMTATLNYDFNTGTIEVSAPVEVGIREDTGDGYIEVGTVTKESGTCTEDEWDKIASYTTGWLEALDTYQFQKYIEAGYISIGNLAFIFYDD